MAMESLNFSNRLHVAEGLDKLPPLDSWVKPNDNDPGYLVVIDDMFAEKNLSALDDYSIRARHRSVSLCFLSQGYISKNESFNKMKSNMDYVLYIPGSSEQKFSKLTRHIHVV